MRKFMRLSEEDKKCIKILYRNGLNVKEIEKLLTAEQYAQLNN